MSRSAFRRAVQGRRPFPTHFGHLYRPSSEGRLPLSMASRFDAQTYATMPADACRSTWLLPSRHYSLGRSDTGQRQAFLA